MKHLSDINVQLVTDIDTASECARWLSTLDRVAIDTEGTGLSPERDHVRLVQFGDLDQAYVVPLEGVTFDRQPAYAQAKGWGGFAVDMLTRIAEDPHGPRIDMQNAPYDHSMIRGTLGVFLPRHRIEDTRIAAHVLDSRTRLGLKELAKLHVDKNADLGQDILHDAMNPTTGWNWATVPIGFKPFWFYAGLDTILTSRVGDKLLPAVRLDAPRSYGLEMAVQWVYEDMERNGVLLDRPYTEEFLAQLEQHVRDLEKWCMQTYRFYPGSDTKVTAQLLKDGVHLTKQTQSGAALSIDKEVLTGVDHPLARGVLARRQSMKVAGYLRSYLDFADEHNIIHPSINTVGGVSKDPFNPGGGNGVRTGRSSMTKPNLQQVPTRTEMGAKVRRCFIPGPGHTWVSADASQIESRILAHYSKDPGLIAAFKSGEDFFVALAKQLFHDPDFQKSDPRRSTLKNGVYAKIYAAGPDKFAKTAGVSVQEAREFMQSFDQRFSGVPAFVRRISELARQRAEQEGAPYVRSPLTGRRLVADEDRPYTVVNYLIQGTAAELLKMMNVRLADKGLTPCMKFPVHDEINMSVPNDQLSEVLATIKETLNDDELLSVPVEWEIGTGENWGEAH